MYILVTYDVDTKTRAGERRLQKVAKICMDYGQRVQNSVFECVLTEVQLVQLKDKLETLIDSENDSIRIYFLNKNENRRIIKLGVDDSVDVEGTLIV